MKRVVLQTKSKLRANMLGDCVSSPYRNVNGFHSNTALYGKKGQTGLRTHAREIFDGMAVVS